MHRQATEIRADDVNGVRSEIFEMNLDTYHVGWLYQWVSQSSLRPFVNFGLGATQFAPPDRESLTGFSFALGGGVKVRVSERFRLRLQGRFLSTNVSRTDRAFCDDAGDCVTIPESYFMRQFGAQVGIGFVI